MDLEIDQSGRIEETNRDTVLAFSNDKKYSIRIKARTKRRLLEQFRMLGRPKLFTLRTFCASIFLLIKNHHYSRIIVDNEYEGRDGLIRDIMGELFKKHFKSRQCPQIIIKQIGKHSPAHILAISVFRKQRKADKIIELKELEKIAIKKSR